MIFSTHKTTMPTADSALQGRNTPMTITHTHFITGYPMAMPLPTTIQQALFGVGCFWGGERKFWQCEGVFSTSVGYSAGFTPNPTYEEVCTGQTGHNEVILVNYDPTVITYEALLVLFWESHNPTQGMQQGNDIGTQYRSGIYTYTVEQFNTAVYSKNQYQRRLNAYGFGEITTEIMPVSTFYYAEDYHQQYLAKNLHGYCGLGGLGIMFSDSSPC